MKTFLAASMLVASISFAPMAMAEKSQADCQAAWKQADANKDGKMDGMEARPFVDAMISAQEISADNKGKALLASDFMRSCKAGTYDTVKL
jgi:hypothetical protein